MRRGRVTYPRAGGLIHHMLRVTSAEADECSRLLRSRLNFIMRHHVGYQHCTSHEHALTCIARNNAQLCAGQTLIERVVVIHRYCLRLRDKQRA